MTPLGFGFHVSAAILTLLLGMAAGVWLILRAQRRTPAQERRLVDNAAPAASGVSREARVFRLHGPNGKSVLVTADELERLRAPVLADEAARRAERKRERKARKEARQ